MSTLRFHAVKESMNRPPLEIEEKDVRRSNLFRKKVFGSHSLKNHSTKEAYRAVKNAIFEGEKIDRKMAEQIATGMKSWALENGATHYTHWFQPLTGSSAEKHDAFFEIDSPSEAIEKFGGDQLIQQEPDASSFPNGGIRNTFEARGYTAWDPTSPAFIIGSTLCIPTIFVAYTGEALDNKTPLLKALNAVDKAATAVVKYFDKNVNKVISTLGWEQEFFLIDSSLVATRPDLQLAGRTLLGHSSAKGQQLDDHYFGSIPSRAMAYLRDLEVECIQLGIPVKTRHNEVAPNQFEIAPIFEEANLAVDHNTLLMDVMTKVAKKHNFQVLLHEKPFKGVNGSGKHNNWSLSTDTGINLLSPGKTPMSNLQFLTFFINTIMAVHDYSDLLRSSISTAGNEHRLGANEAPPAIISIFIGEQLTKVLNKLEDVSQGILSPDEKTDLKLNVVGKIPYVLLDNTDRNRTSPFAFTGNKFEFRAVGSSANCANPMIILNTIIAEQLTKFKEEVDRLKQDGMKKDDAIFNVLREYIKKSKSIRFEGDGYADEWVIEAEKRGLTNIKEAPNSINALLDEKSIKLFENQKVMSEVELRARHEIKLDDYTLKIQIEGRILGDLAKNHIIPTAFKYQNNIIKNVKGLKDIFGEDYQKYASEQLIIIKDISKHIGEINSNVDKMIDERRKANKIENSYERAMAYNQNVKSFFDKIRYHCDKLEIMVDDEIWPLTKYRELLFTK